MFELPASSCVEISTVSKLGMFSICAFRGQHFTAPRRFIFKRKNEAQLYYPQNHLKDSAVIAWPVELKRIRGTGQDYYEPILPQREPTLITIYDIKDISARCITFKSWAFQKLNFSDAKLIGMNPAVRIWPTSPVEPFVLYLLSVCILGNVTIMDGVAPQRSGRAVG